MRKKAIICILLALTSTPLLAWSQATSALLIPINNQTVQTISKDLSQIDLLKEVKKLKPALNAAPQIEIQMVRIEAKSKTGGAQVFLKINSGLVASAVVETNPDLFGSLDPRSFEVFELRNIERSRISAASLQIENFQNLRLKSVEVIFGAVQEPVIFGRYAQEQAVMIGTGNDNQDTRPTAAALSKIYASHYGVAAPAPEYVSSAVVRPDVSNRPVAPVRTVAPVKAKPPTAKPAVNSRCISNSRGRQFCVGDSVKNAFGFDQRITAIDAGNRRVTLVSDLYDEPYIRSVDML